jgi:pimeloyl-ACP methyl ester carboxylesterase
MNPWDYQRNLSPTSRPESWHRAVVDYLLAGVHAEDAHHALWRYEVETRLPLIKCFTLLIGGTEDIFFSRFEVTKSLIPQCRTKVIDGGGIHLAYERSKEFAEAIDEFLSGLET